MGVDPAEVLGRVRARRLDRCQQAALVAAHEAWADAGAPGVDPDRLAVVIGPTGMNVVLKLSSFLLVCIGVQIFWNGASQLLGSLLR